ncbi:MAG: TonB-dependent receptor [Opitutae bacterium]|nr:TonB-dependent receptor [Opitutae bacterium]
MKFEIPAQPAPAALMAFAKQARTEVVFSADDLRNIRANEVMGSFEPEEAMGRLLKNTGFTHHRNGGGKFVVAAVVAATGSVRGALVGEGGALAGVLVAVRETGQSTETDKFGAYVFPKVAAGTYVLVATAPGYQPLHIVDVKVSPGGDLSLGQEAMRKPLDEVTKLDPVVVHAENVEELDPYQVYGKKVKPFATRNVDVPRTINDVQPYFIYGAKEIERSGVTTLENFLHKKLTMNATPASADQGIFIGGVAFGNVNLRGLGSSQTLILLNGRRMGTGDTVPAIGTLGNVISAIPLGAVERIEVLPTSAGAIYGSNAVGGVINIILKRNYTGGELRLSYQNTFDRDASIRSADLSYGFSLEGGRTQVMLTAGYSDRGDILYQDRPILRDYGLRVLRNSADPANPFRPAGFGIAQFTFGVPFITSSANLVLKPAYGGGALNSFYTYVPLGITPTTAPLELGAALAANAGKFPTDPFIPAANSRASNGGMLQTLGHAPTLESFGATLRRQMTSNLDFNAEFSVTRQRTFRFGVSTGTRSVAATSPFNPFTTSVSLNIPRSGDKPSISENYARRFSAGLVLTLPRDWKLQADYTWNFGTSTYETYFAGAGIGSALGITYNPFVDTTAFPLDLSQYGFGKQTSVGNGGGTNDAALRGSGPVWTLPGGAVLLTFGLESRREGFGDVFNSNISTDGAGVVLPFSFASTSLGKSQGTRSAYLELQVPVVSEKNPWPFVRELNLQVAGRREDFKVQTGTSSVTTLPVPATPPVILSSTAKYSSTQPTFGFGYRPVQDVMLRVSYSGGFLAPSYSQLALDPTPSPFPSTIVDPKRGNASYGVLTIGGGNPGLTPELSKSWNAGLVFEPRSGPLRGLRASADYFLIRKQNNIGSLSAAQFVAMEDQYPGRVTRAAPVAGDPFGVGVVTTVSTAPLNLLRSLNEGVDLTLGYRKTTAEHGSFDFSATGTYNILASRKTSLTTANAEITGFSGSSGGVPTWLANGSLTWDRRNWTAGWTTRFYPRNHIAGPPLTSSTTPRRDQGGEWASSQIYSDAFVAYRFDDRKQGAAGRWAGRLTRGLELEVGINNVFNKIPAFDTSSGSYNYSTWGDIRLREYRLSVKKAL